jgi:16S rRNA (adenine1518-N6/adenine1519-N6)-dimethyltransferase
MVFNMQTKQHIEQLLDGMGIRPNKRHGQNFLIDLNLMRFLVDAAALTAEDFVLEVGPGTGSMTQEIAWRGCKVIAVEIDAVVAQIAGVELKDLSNVELLHADILETKNLISPAVSKLISARRSKAGRFVLVSNLPYNAGTPVMMNLITDVPYVDAMYVTVQKEVAQRMTAEAGEAAYGTLSIMMAATGSAKILKTLKPTCFWPQPDVDSAMVAWVRDKDKTASIKDIHILSDVVALFLQHRRKMLRAATKFAAGRLEAVSDWNAVFKAANVTPESRPDDLTPQDFVRLANVVRNLTIN